MNALALLVAAVGGCTADDGLPGGEPDLDPAIIASADPATVPRPLWAFRYSDAEARIVSSARVVLAQRCMAPFGFSPDPRWEPEGLAIDDWRRYGLWDPIALTNGYWGRIAPDAPPLGLPVPYVHPDASDVYFGMVDEFNGLPVPPGGCASFSESVVPADLESFDFSLVGNLDREAQDRAAQDRRVRPLLDAWRGCMRDRGWDYADALAPFQYWESRRGVQGDTVISADELRSARDDLDCKHSTGLLGTWLAADIAYQESIVERDGERLREFRQKLDQITENANRIIAEG